MKHFNIGEKFEVKLRTNKRWGEIAGECEIIEVKEIQENEIHWKETSVRDSFSADGGTITVILRTQTNNEKPKTFKLNIAKHSEDFCKKMNCTKEYYWFSPSERSYQTIDTQDK